MNDRAGRAIYILQQTLPTFFSTGLISSVDISGTNSRTKDDDELSIYSPNIRLEYRPPTPFPPPFPRTLHVEGTQHIPYSLAPPSLRAVDSCTQASHYISHPLLSFVTL